MERLAFKMHLKKGMKSEYKRRHNIIWPELAALLKDEGICEYSIFFDEETSTLFAFQKTSSKEGSQNLGSNPIVQKWWKHMADIMETNPDNSPKSADLEEVFYLD